MVLALVASYFCIFHQRSGKSLGGGNAMITQEWVGPRGISLWWQAHPDWFIRCANGWQLFAELMPEWKSWCWCWNGQLCLNSCLGWGMSVSLRVFCFFFCFFFSGELVWGRLAWSLSLGGGLTGSGSVIGCRAWGFEEFCWTNSKVELAYVIVS